MRCGGGPKALGRSPRGTAGRRCTPPAGRAWVAQRHLRGSQPLKFLIEPDHSSLLIASIKRDRYRRGARAGIPQTCMGGGPKALGRRPRGCPKADGGPKAWVARRHLRGSFQSVVFYTRVAAQLQRGGHNGTKRMHDTGGAWLQRGGRKINNRLTPCPRTRGRRGGGSSGCSARGHRARWRRRSTCWRGGGPRCTPCR